MSNEKEMKHGVIHIYTDGSTVNNGYKNSTGGFGVVVLEVPEFCANDNDAKLINIMQQRTSPTTSNREEMKAILWAMENYGKYPLGTPVVFSDSRYAINTFTQWMWGWKDSGWKRVNGSTPENLDLVKQYDRLISQGYRIQLEKVRGHSGDIGNTLADWLATGKVSKEEVIKNGLNLQNYKYYK